MKSIVNHLADRLKELPQANSFRIVDGWVGLSPFAPRQSAYLFRRQQDAFRGQGKFTIGYSPKGLGVVRGLTVPFAEAQEFFELLMRAPFKPGKYESYCGWTDDFPFIQIRIGTGTDSLTFVTKSQGKYHSPWAIRFRRTTFVVHSSLPQRAYNHIKPYLAEFVYRVHQNTYESLEDEWSARDWQTAPLENLRDFEKMARLIYPIYQRNAQVTKDCIQLSRSSNKRVPTMLFMPEAIEVRLPIVRWVNDKPLDGSRLYQRILLSELPAPETPGLGAKLNQLFDEATIVRNDEFTLCRYCRQEYPREQIGKLGVCPLCHEHVASYLNDWPKVFDHHGNRLENPK